MGNTAIIIVVFVLYLCVMLGIGWNFYRKNKNVKDYVLGGRTLGPWATALSAQASDMSGWLLMGLPGLAYALYEGTTEAIWTGIGLALGTYLNWLIVAKRLRKYTKLAGDSITLPEFFQNRFHDKSGVIKAISSIFILIFFLLYSASMFSAGAKLFKSVFDIPYLTALIIGVIIIVSYTFLGGFLAVCWTDVLQGSLMFVCLLLTPIFAFQHLGGSAGLSESFASIEAEFNFLPLLDNGNINFLLLVSALGWGLGYFGQPHILARFMGIRKANEVRPARIIATIWVVITLTAAVIIGMLGRFVLPGLSDPESVFIHLSDKLFPGIVTGILLTAILAAIMSTADSQLLVTSSAVSNDLYGGIINKKADSKRLMWISRITVIIVSIVAAFLVSQPSTGIKPVTFMEKLNESVFKLVAFAWAGFGAAFGPLILFSLFWNKTTKLAALLGMISGGVTACIWWSLDGGIFDVYEIVPGFLVSTIVIVVVSLFTKVSSEIIEEFDNVKNVEL